MRVRAAALAGLVAATPAFAGHEDHAGQSEPAVAADVACRKEAASAVDKLLGSLPAQIEAIRETEDPAERQRLLRDHLLSMEKVLQLMARPGSGASEPPSGIEKRADTAGERGKRAGHGMMDKERGGGQGMMMHRVVEDRLDRLQKLVQQIIEHELAEEGTDLD